MTALANLSNRVASYESFQEETNQKVARFDIQIHDVKRNHAKLTPPPCPQAVFTGASLSVAKPHVLGMCRASIRKRSKHFFPKGFCCPLAILLAVPPWLTNENTCFNSGHAQSQGGLGVNESDQWLTTVGGSVNVERLP